MEKLFLGVQLREELGRAKVKELREQGFIPAVIYGEGKSAQAIKVSHKELFQLLHQHRLENVVINLKIQNSENKDKSCLIKEIQYHPVKNDIIHVDFNEVSLTKLIKINVPIAAKGDPVGVKQDGGVLEHILWEIEIECLPGDIPKEIEVDVAHLKIGDAIHIKDISLPPNIKVITDASAVILSVAAPIKEEAAAPAEEEGKQEPEVIKEKKEAAAESGEEKPEKK